MENSFQNEKKICFLINKTIDIYFILHFKLNS